MIYSMTGYAVASADYAGASAGAPRGMLTLELRTVNSRYLDLQFRVAEELRAAEPLLREIIAGRITRGKVDCRLYYGDSAPQAKKHLNPLVMEQLRELAAQAEKAFPGGARLSIADVLRWPGVLAEPEMDEGAARATLDALARRVLDELNAARGREGAKLAAILLGKVGEMRRQLTGVAPLVPEAVAAHRARLAERLREVLDAGVEERVRAEVALFAAKSDVDEEITRLATHLDEVERVLAKGAAPGAKGGLHRQAARFPGAGTEPRGKYPCVQGRRAENSGLRARVEIADRTNSGTGSEHRMSGCKGTR